MKHFLLDIEKRLDHQVNAVCTPCGVEGSVDTIMGPDRFNEALGTPLRVVHHQRHIPPPERSRIKKDYFTLDFEDFLEFATSDLTPSLSIDLLPDPCCYYYQALPGTFDKPLVTNKYSSFSVIGVCLSRFENGIWIIAHLKKETESSRKLSKITDLVGDMNGFWQEFICLHLVDYQLGSNSSEWEWFEEKKISWDKNNMGSSKLGQSKGLVEFTRSNVLPPMWTNLGKHNEYGVGSSGDMWTSMYWELLTSDFGDIGPRDEKILSDYLMSAYTDVLAFKAHFETSMADEFEIARLMVFLPSYFEFMYDLVINEKKTIGYESRLGDFRNKKRKTRKKSIYQIVKSLRVSYEAEEQARKELNLKPRSWTAPPYGYVVRGHWRQFPNSFWKGHDEYGQPVTGKTWVKEYKKGSEIEKNGPVDTVDPNVTIRIKQTLSYARDVIKSHQNSLDKIDPVPATVETEKLTLCNIQPKGQKPTIEWMHYERVKLTSGLRRIVFKRDNFKCVLCGRNAIDDGVRLEVDHIIPLAKWGRTELNNLRLLCMECNRGKGAEF